MLEGYEVLGKGMSLWRPSSSLTVLFLPVLVSTLILSMRNSFLPSRKPTFTWAFHINEICFVITKLTFFKIKWTFFFYFSISIIIIFISIKCVFYMHSFSRVNDLNTKNCAHLNISQLRFSGTMTVKLKRGVTR